MVIETSENFEEEVFDLVVRKMTDVEFKDGLQKFIDEAEDKTNSKVEEMADLLFAINEFENDNAELFSIESINLSEGVIVLHREEDDEDEEYSIELPLWLITEHKSDHMARLEF